MKEEANAAISAIFLVKSSLPRRYMQTITKVEGTKTSKNFRAPSASPIFNKGTARS